MIEKKSDKAISEVQQAVDPLEKLEVTGNGLCYHLCLNYIPHEWIPSMAETPPSAECGACGKRWEFSITERKFVEVTR